MPTAFPTLLVSSPPPNRIRLVSGKELAWRRAPDRRHTLGRGGRARRCTSLRTDCLGPPGGWHQMFGRGVEIQGNSSAMREEGNIMLLQLVADDLMQWSFGDNGIYQFWISPSDLAGQNWTGVQMTFECH